MKDGKIIDNIIFNLKDYGREISLKEVLDKKTLV